MSFPNKAKKYISEMPMPKSKSSTDDAADESDEEDMGADLFPASKSSEDTDESDAGPLAEFSDADLLREAQKRGLDVKMPDDEESDSEDSSDAPEEGLDLQDDDQK